MRDKTRNLPPLSLKHNGPLDLRFGFTALSSYADMPELVQRYRLARPSVHIELVQGETSSLAASLLSDEIDIALLHPPLSLSGLQLKEGRNWLRLCPEFTASHPAPRRRLPQARKFIKHALSFDGARVA